MNPTLTLLIALLLAPLAAVQAADTPALFEPSRNAVLTTSIPHFQWMPLFADKPEAMPAYDIQIASDQAFSQLVDEDRLAAVITWYVPDKELAPGDYWWRVAGVAAPGARGPWSAPRRFAVRQPERVVEVPKSATFSVIQGALAEVAKQTPAILKFEPGDYRLDPGGAAVFINYTNATDLVIDGGGAKITFTGFLKFVDLEHCQRVLVKNFTFDFDPLPYTAGRVLAVDAKAGTFEVQIEPGHPLLETSPHFERDRKGMLVDPKFPRMKQGVTLTFQHNGWQKLGDRRYRFQAAKAGQVSELAVGDVYVLDPRTKSCIGFDVNGGSDVVFYRIVCHSVANEAFTSQYANRHAIIHCGIELLPGRFLAANNGGHNHFSARLGPWIEGGTWENAGDDTCHISALPSGIQKKLAPNRLHLALSNPHDTVGAALGLDTHPGDRLQFFCPANGQLISERRVVAAEKQGSSLDVTLDGDVGAVVPGRLVKGTVTRVFNASRMCNQFVFRNNLVRNGRRVGVIAKGENGLIEHNTFAGLGAGGVEFWNSPNGGLAAAHYVVRGNRIHECSLLRDAHSAIFSSIYQTGGHRLHHDLLIEHNEISGCPSPVIRLRDLENTMVRGNHIVLAPPLTDQPQPVEPLTLENTNAVRLESNTIKKSNP